MAPQVSFKPLSRADGSATYSDNLFSILASVSGPVEVQRRDELPEEAAVEINVRPLSGAGGPRERWLEDVVQSLLRSILLVHLYPRSLIQVTLQVTKEPGMSFTRTRGDVGVLPSLINAAFIGLVDVGLPLRTTAIAGLIAGSTDGQLVTEPTAKELSTAESVHAMVFDKDGTLLMDESAGVFSYTRWEKAASLLRDVCISAIQESIDDDEMDLDKDRRTPWLREAFEERITQANAWREAT